MSVFILTNARTNSPVVVNVATIGDMQARTDEKYPDTKVALVKLDGSFTPIKEDIYECIKRMQGALRSAPVQMSTPVQRTQVQRPEPEGHPEER